MAQPDMSPGTKRVLGLLGAAIAGAGLWLGLMNDAWDLACKVSTRWQFCRQPEILATDARPGRPVRMIQPTQLTRRQAGDCKYLLLPALKTLYPPDVARTTIGDVTFRMTGAGDGSAWAQSRRPYEFGSVVSVKDVDSGIDYYATLALHTPVDSAGKRRSAAQWMGFIRFTDDRFFAVTIRNAPHTGDDWSIATFVRRNAFALKPLTIEQFREQAGRVWSLTGMPACEDAPDGPVFAK